MSKKVKALEIDALRAAIGQAKDYVIVEPVAVDAATDFAFRKNLRAKNIKATLVKNTYAKKIFGELGIGVDQVWGGPTLLCFGGASPKELGNTVDDQIKAAKKDPKAPDKFKVKTAVLDGQPVGIDVIKTAPTREEAIGDILGALLGAGSALAGCLTGPASQLASILSTIEEKGPAGGDPATVGRRPPGRPPRPPPGTVPGRLKVRVGRSLRERSARPRSRSERPTHRTQPRPNRPPETAITRSRRTASSGNETPKGPSHERCLRNSAISSPN
jgi:large subunit ribosomal protein L10